MIYTVTPNPTLDLGGVVEKLIPNEKAYVHDETCFPGGNAINAARIIRKLGNPVVASGFLGGGIGQEVEFRLKKEGVGCQFIQVQGHTRIGVTVSQGRTHLQTRLSFPGPKIRPREMRSLVDWMGRLDWPSLVVIGGSLPPGFSVPLLKRAMKRLRQRSVPVVVDVPGKALKQLIDSQPILIKPNLTEFQELMGRKVTSVREVIRAARNLTQKIPYICVSSVQDGALLVAQEGTWYGKIPKVHVRTTVGAGDSMVGAMSAHLSNASNSSTVIQPGDLLRWGLAAATATLTTPGTMLGEHSEIMRYYPQIRISKVDERLGG